VVRTFRVADGFKRKDAEALDLRIRQMKVLNNGRATAWMLFGGPDPSGEMPTVHDFVRTKFIEHVVHQLKPRTRDEYLNHLDTILYGTGPHDGGDVLRLTDTALMRLDEIRSKHVVSWLQELTKAGALGLGRRFSRP
jgi:hypothetical protein